MIAAIYARNPPNRTACVTTEKSVTRQIEHAKAYAEQKGWLVPDDCIFVDDGISGAEFKRRPGYLSLMNALKPKPRFQVLVMSESSRLGRESFETGYALKELSLAGVEVWLYLAGPEVDLDDAQPEVPAPGRVLCR